MNQSKKSSLSGQSKSRQKQQSHKSNSHSVNSNKSNGFSTDSKVINEENKLVRKLLSLQMELMEKINDLKAQKISVLEDYNKEFDKFTQLSLRINKNTLESQTSSQVQTNDNKLKNRQGISNQAKLKQILEQLYEISQQNEFQQANLNADQLQELSKLLIFHSSNKKRHLNPPFISQQTTISESILVMRQAIEHHLPKRMIFLQQQQQLLRSFQSQSRKNVESLLRRKSIVEKEIVSLNQLLKEYEQRYEIYRSRQRIIGGQSQKGEWMEKYERMVEYQRLKSQLNNLQKLSKWQKLEQVKNQDSKYLQQQQKQINRLEEEIKCYEEFSQEENLQKIQLFNEINQKQKQFQQIKRQNQIMASLIKLIIS